MASISATLAWRMTEGDFLKGKYSRVHEWQFDGGAAVRASSSPAIVPPPGSDPAAVDPEEAFLAALASCHMLTFLHIASRKGFAVASYVDHAAATMAKSPNGSLWVDAAELHPAIEWAGEKRPTPEELEQMHHMAHEQCFIANSVRTSVTVRHSAAARAGA